MAYRFFTPICICTTTEIFHYVVDSHFGDIAMFSFLTKIVPSQRMLYTITVLWVSKKESLTVFCQWSGVWNV